MRMRLAFLVAACMIAGIAQADTVRLKNGNTVEGNIIEKTAEGVKVDIGGVTLTYYADEVESIVAAPAPAATAEEPAPVAAAEALAPAPAVEVQQVPAGYEAFTSSPGSPAPAVAEAPAPVPVPVVTEAPAAPAPVQDELAGLTKDELIKKFVQIYGVKENMQENFDQMTTTLKADQAEAFRQSVKVDEIVQLLLPIYDKHFSADDLRAYIHFYASAEGKKLVQTLPLLMKDSVDVSMKYLDTHLPESLKQEQPAAGK